MKSKLVVSEITLILLAFLGMLLHLSALSPEETSAHVGEEATVEGVAVEVSVLEKIGAHINFGGKYPKETFAAYIRPKAVKEIGEDFLKSLEGKTLALTGIIKSYKDKPEMIIQHRDQIKVSSVSNDSAISR